MHPRARAREQRNDREATTGWLSRATGSKSQGEFGNCAVGRLIHSYEHDDTRAWSNDTMHDERKGRRTEAGERL
jgi:hypothetical protein